MSDAEKRKRKTGRDAERGHTSGAGLRKKKEKKKQRGVSIGGGDLYNASNNLYNT